MTLSTFENQSVHTLQVGDSRANIAPQFGGRLLDWTLGRQPIIHWPDSVDWADRSAVVHTRGGNPILFPFVARHYVEGVLGQWRDGSGTTRSLPMHGFARDLPFEVVESATDEIRMRLTDTAETQKMYPFSFVFDVVYRLYKSSLEVTFETTNTSEIPLPYYAGHHFYFAIPHKERSKWTISLPCRFWGRQNADGSPTFSDAREGITGLDNEALIDRFHIDFFKPRVILANGTSQRSILLEWDTPPPSWYNVTTWTAAPDSDFYCVEPWLGLPDAIHHGHGLRSILPGRTESILCRITAAS